jgi:hypothetical protein
LKEEEEMPSMNSEAWRSSHAVDAWLLQEEASLTSRRFSTEPMPAKAIEKWLLQEMEPRPIMRKLVARASSDGCSRIRKASNQDHHFVPVEKKRRCSNEDEPVRRPRSYPPPKPPKASAPPTFTSKDIYKLLVGPVYDFDMPETQVDGIVSAVNFPWA